MAGAVMNSWKKSKMLFALLWASGSACSETSFANSAAESGSTDGEGSSGEEAGLDVPRPARCPEKRIEERVLVQTDEELQALAGATYIESLLIFKPVSSLEPLVVWKAFLRGGCLYGKPESLISVGSRIYAKDSSH